MPEETVTKSGSLSQLEFIYLNREMLKRVEAIEALEKRCADLDARTTVLELMVPKTAEWHTHDK